SEPSGPGRPWQLLALSARSESSLETVTDNLAQHLEEHAAGWEDPARALADAAFTLHLGRAAFEERRILVCREAEAAAASLRQRDRRRVLSATVGREQGSPPVVYLFPGQGAQYVDMGRELYDGEPTFRSAVDQCCELLRPDLGSDLRQVLYPAAGEAKGAAQKLRRTVFTQPALYVVEYALAQLWIEWGLRPQAMLGHSIGEYVAATLAGVLSLADALALVAARARLMQETPRGVMVSIALPADEVLPLLTPDPELALAAVNGPGLCVVSGPPAAVDRLRDALAERQVEAKPLKTSHAFHSVLMEPILERFHAELGKVELRAPRIPYLSNLTGTWIRPEEATDPGYWVRHLRSTVRFSAAVEELLSRPERILLEVGPGRSLGALVRQHPGGREARVVASLHRTRNRSEAEFLLRTLGELWLGGAGVDWTSFYAHQRRRRVALPTYPFERQRYWIEPSRTPVEPAREPLTPLPDRPKKQALRDWFFVPTWERSARPAATPAGGRWLLFVDACGVGSEIAQKLRFAGAAVVTVEPGEEFAQLGPGRYAVRLSAGEDYEVLLAELQRDGGIPPRWVHLWNVTAEATESDLPDRSFFSLLSQMQALGRQESVPAIELGIVSTGLQSVDDGEPLCPEKALLLGPCKVIPQEYPSVRCRSIDVVLDAPGEVAEQLIAELSTESADAVVAWRGGTRWAQGFAPAPLDPPEEPRLRPQGVYLITGGMGGL
ncbi:MAG: acyltransferase domain-containing protein, partial [bacterium]|nr:acyltransferase domain-containing protein [bacterium]